MNLVENLSAALQREQRRPVDLNLGQVPITPTIGRMGNYNVVTRTVVRDNAASELSRALSQLPQLIGQARNISEASGRQQAEDLTLDQIEERWKKGDTEAEGFMQWLGGNKAFEEAAYQRIFDASIKPSLTKVSGEIDNMSIAELSQLKSDEDISEFVQGRLVGGLDPEILQTIQNSPFQAIKHNRALEALIPEYTQRAAANINARKNAFQKKEAKRAIESNFFSGADVGFDDANPKAYTDNLQATIKFAKDNAIASGLDKFEFEDALMPVLTTQINNLIEDERFSEVDVILDQIESGDLKVNGRPLNQTLKGVEMLTRAEKALEFAETQSEDIKVDQKAVDSFALPLFDKVSEFMREGDFSEAALNTEIEALNNLRADLDQRNDVNDATLLKMYEVIDRQKAQLRNESSIYSEFSESLDSKTKGQFLSRSGLGSQRLRAALESEEKLVDIATAAGVGSELQATFVEITGADGLPTGQGKMSTDPMMPFIVESAFNEAQQDVIGGFMNTEEFSTLLTPQTTDELQQKQKDFFAEVNDVFMQKYEDILGAALKDHFEEQKALNPTPTPTEIQRNQAQEFERDKFLKQAREGGSTLNDKGELVKDEVIGKEVENEQELLADVRTYVDVKDYSFPKGINDLNNAAGRELIKDNPLAKKMEFALSMSRQAQNYTRLTDIGEKIDTTHASQSEPLLKQEIDMVKYTGISLRTLLNSNGAGLAEGDYQSGLFGTNLKPWKIRYNAFGNYTNPAETSQRIYNMQAVLEYVRNGDRTVLDRIQKALLPSMDPETFADNQAKLLEEVYGNMKNTEQQQQEQNNE